MHLTEEQIAEALKGSEWETRVTDINGDTIKFINRGRAMGDGNWCVVLITKGEHSSIIHLQGVKSISTDRYGLVWSRKQEKHNDCS